MWSYYMKCERFSIYLIILFGIWLPKVYAADASQKYFQANELLYERFEYADALKIYQSAASSGESLAMGALVEIYEQGYGVKENPGLAEEYALKAFSALKTKAGAGNKYAQYHLAFIYMKGYISTRSAQSPLELFKASFNQGFARAGFQIGKMYGNGTGVKKNIDREIKWYRKAAEKGDPSAMNNLGFSYHFGSGVNVDYQTALKWYKKAAQKGSAAAMNNIGVMYEQGLGVTKDYDKAIHWYKKAINKDKTYMMPKNNLAKLERAMSKTQKQNQSVSSVSRDKVDKSPKRKYTEKEIKERSELAYKYMDEGKKEKGLAIFKEIA